MADKLRLRGHRLRVRRSDEFGTLKVSLNGGGLNVPRGALPVLICTLFEELSPEQRREVMRQLQVEKKL